MTTRPTVILVRPREEGNIGSVARAMANMGLEQLVLVEPAPSLGGVARGFGVGGWHILDSCQRATTFAEATAPFRRLVGTTSTRERPLRHTRVISSRQLPPLLARDAQDTTTALVFGPEDNGLTRAELESCEPVVAVPCDPDHPTLNLAQSVLILAYELYLAPTTKEPTEEPAEEPTEEFKGDFAPPATARELETLLERGAEVLAGLGIDQESRRDTYLRDLSRMARRGGATSREIRLLLRLANRTLFALNSRARATET